MHQWCMGTDREQHLLRATQLERRPGAPGRLFLNHAGCMYPWICATTLAPSPIAPPTRFTEPERTSPIAKTPGTLVASGKLASAPVFTKPFASIATSQPSSHAVSGSAP